MKDKVTACLIVWKRQQNLPRIIESLTKHDFINEILIRDNSKSKNIINYGRYTLAQKASNKIIYTQDDDCIVNNIDEIYQTFLKDPTRIAHAGTEEYLKQIPNNTFGNKQMCMAGWGSIFNKNWLPHLNTYTNVYGKDYCFYRETDRIFSILLNKHHNAVLGDIEHLDLKDDPDIALCQQADHIKYKKLAIERALKL